MKRFVPWLWIVAGLALIPVARAGMLSQEQLAMHSPLGCPFLKFTGFYCAGCGGTRAFFAFLKGDLAKSWSMNPIFLTGLVVGLLWLALSAWDRSPRGRPAWLKRMRFTASTGWCVLGLIILFTVLRNIPTPPFNVLAPH